MAKLKGADTASTTTSDPTAETSSAAPAEATPAPEPAVVTSQAPAAETAPAAEPTPAAPPTPPPAALPSEPAPVATSPAPAAAPAADDDWAYLVGVIKKQAAAPTVDDAERAAKSLPAETAKQVVAAGRSGQVKLARQLLGLE